MYPARATVSAPDFTDGVRHRQIISFAARRTACDPCSGRADDPGGLCAFDNLRAGPVGQHHKADVGIQRAAPDGVDHRLKVRCRCPRRGRRVSKDHGQRSLVLSEVAEVVRPSATALTSAGMVIVLGLDVGRQNRTWPAFWWSRGRCRPASRAFPRAGAVMRVGGHRRPKKLSHRGRRAEGHRNRRRPSASRRRISSLSR